jgi:hypothetical protein
MGASQDAVLHETQAREVYMYPSPTELFGTCLGILVSSRYYVRQSRLCATFFRLASIRILHTNSTVASAITHFPHLCCEGFDPIHWLYTTSRAYHFFQMR